jgi:hypothetical protein
MAGISEAVERAAEHGSYEWLRVMPILKKFRKSHGGSDRVRVPPALGEKHAAKFASMAEAIMDDVATQDDISAVEKPTHEQSKRDCQQVRTRIASHPLSPSPTFSFSSES